MSNKFKKRYSVWDGLDLLSWTVFFASGYFTDFHYHLYLPSVYLILRSIGRRKAIKADLKNAVDYCRVSRPVTQLVLRMAIAIAVGLSFAYGFDYIKPYLPSSEYNDYNYLLITGFIYVIIGSHLHNFTEGVRWYISGIKLPGERSLLIPWRHITSIKVEGRDIHIDVFGKHHEFVIEEEDHTSAEHFARWFEKKKRAESSN